MNKRFTYNAYDNGEIILKNVTSQEIRDHIGEKALNIAGYANNGHKYKGRYTFEIVDETDAKRQEEIEFINAWTEAVRPFKNVIWVKSGGRKLKVGGKKYWLKLQ